MLNRRGEIFEVVCNGAPVTCKGPALLHFTQVLPWCRDKGNNIYYFIATNRECKEMLPGSHEDGGVSVEGPFIGNVFYFTEATVNDHIPVLRRVTLSLGELSDRQIDAREHTT